MRNGRLVRLAEPAMQDALDEFALRGDVLLGRDARSNEDMDKASSFARGRALECRESAAIDDSTGGREVSH